MTLLDPGFSLTLRPMKYPTFYKMYKDAIANTWSVEELNFEKDIMDLHTSKLTPEQMHIVKRLVAFFATGDTIVANNLVLTLYKHINAPEARMYLGRQLFEECFAEGTEILTTDGWVKFEDLTDQKVAQFDPITHEVSFVAPVHKTVRKQSGTMIEFTGQRFHQMVTPNHRMVYRRYGETDFKFSEARAFSTSRNNQIPVAGLKTSGRKNLTFKERFLIALQADGHIVTHNVTTGARYSGVISGTVPVTFTFSKKRKVERMQWLADNLGWAFKKHGKRNYTLSVPKDEFLSKNFDWVRLEDVSHEWAEEFLDEILNWDGTRSGNNRYCTTNESCFKVVQALGALCNRRCSNNQTLLPSGKIHYQSSLVEKPVICADVTKQEVDYEGMVYCVTVPSGAIIVRSNEHVSVSGNCLHVQGYLTLLDNYIPNHEERHQMFKAVETIPSIAAKAAFADKYTTLSDNLDLSIKPNRKKFLLTQMCFAACIEGIFFYAAFAYVYWLRSQGLLTELASLTNWVFRDEGMHMKFGFECIETIRHEEPYLFDDELEFEVRKMLDEAVACEHQFAVDLFGADAIPGFKLADMKTYLEFVKRQRLQDLGYSVNWYDAEGKPIVQPFPFMELQGMQSLVNFFGRTPTDYVTGIEGQVSFDEDF